ncbi:MAG: hypothetical protein HY289_08115 [Planctomycetes bacterium]|nr:hypothetical protein [Planctomycetota bacterium]
MEWNEQKVLLNIRQAETDDLLDRVTAYRAGMETDAIAMIEQELHRRGVPTAEIEARQDEYQRKCLFHEDGTAKKCSYCRKPAVAERTGWLKLFFFLPVIPRRTLCCEDHVAKR